MKDSNLYVNRCQIKLMNKYGTISIAKLQNPRKRIFVWIGWNLIRLGSNIMFSKIVTYMNEVSE